MKVKVNGALVSETGDRGYMFLCQIPNLEDAILLKDKLSQDKDYTLNIAEYRKKRSNDANALLWEWCTQISEKLSDSECVISKEDVYRSHIKAAGVCEFLSLPSEGADRFIENWTSNNGIGWFAEKVDYGENDSLVTVCVYYGSSTYNTKEMSRLIKSVKQDADAIGIDTRSIDEINLQEG